MLFREPSKTESAPLAKGPSDDGKGAVDESRSRNSRSEVEKAKLKRSGLYNDQPRHLRADV